MAFFSRSSSRAFSLIELLVAFSIMIVIVIATMMFAGDVFDYASTFREVLEVQQEIQLTLRTLVPEIRSMVPSGNGAYSISAAASSSFLFYTDYDGDGVSERVRYFLTSSTLQKGVIDPTGSPLVYNPASEIVTDMVHNMVVSSSSIFSYYDTSYTGTELPLSFPVAVASIRMVKVTISARDPGQNTPVTFSVKLTPRNLRTNL